MNCTRCRWHLNKAGINCVGYSGPKDAKLVFCGEACSDSEGKAFIGITGEQLDKLFKTGKIDKAKVAIMNAQRCYLDGNPTPTKKEMDACFFNTYNDINEIKPDLVIALGGPALYQTTGLEGITKHRGKVYVSEKLGGVKVFATFHPSAVKYDEHKYNKLVTDFKNLRNALEDKPFEVVHYPYIYIDKWQQIDDMMDELRGKEINLDIETTGLDAYQDTVTLIQLSANTKKIFVIDMRTITNKPYVLSKINELMVTCPIVGQDFTFDAKFLKAQYSIYPKLWEFDTCLAEYILTGFKANDLDFLTDKYAPESMGYSDEVKRAGGAHKILDKKKLLQYAADDSGVMHKIKRKQRKALMKQKCMWNDFTAEWCYKNLTLPCNEVLTRMSIRGLQYNTEKLQAIDEKYAKRGRRAMMKAKALEGVKACEKAFRQTFNPRSTLHIRWLMLEYYKLPVLKTTDHNNPSIGKDEMKIYAKDKDGVKGNEYCKIMVKYRSIQNIRNNFLSGVLPKLRNGVAHTDFSLHGTASGRPTSKDPNVLNIPDDDDIRSCIHPRDGYVFVYSDLSQIEVREAAVIYNEPKLIEYCNTAGKDFHCMTTANMFNLDYDEVYKWYRESEAGSKDKRAIKMHAQRSAAKTVTFGILYQMGPDELAYRLGITKKKAEEFIRKYFEGFPNLQENIEKIKAFVIKNGYVDTWFGFRRQWQFHDKKEHNTQREAVNHPIQGTAWNILEKILIDVDGYLVDNNFQSKLIWQNYDSICVEAKEDEVDDIAPKMQSIMESVQEPFETLNRVQIKADIKKGYSLGHLEQIL